MNKVFINSLPKSGTNLLAKCLDLLGYKEQGHLSAGTILDKGIINSLRRLFWSPYKEGYLLGVDSPIKVSRFWINRKLKSVKDGEYLSGHLGYTEELLEIIIASGYSPLVITRDPRAVLASFVPYVCSDYNHFLNKIFTNLTEDERYLAALNGISGQAYSLRSLRERCRALAPWLKSEKVLHVRFEDLIGEKGGSSAQVQLSTLLKLAEFLNVPPERIKAIQNDLFGSGRHTFRSGKIDSWRDEIPGDILKEANRDLRNILNEWGYR